MAKSSHLLFIVTFILIGFGLVAIYSTSAIFAEEKFGDSLFFLKRQLLWASLGLVTMLAAWRVKYELIRALGKPLLFLTLTLLILVLLPQFGREVGGAQRWLRIGGFSFQPSELGKLALLIYLADYLARKQDRIKSFSRGFFPPLLIVGGIVGLIFLQPDLGTGLFIGMVFLVLLFVAGVRIIHLAGFALSSLPVLYFLIMGADYRLRRLLTFLDPGKDPLGAGFQITQSFLALGLGGMRGVGLGESRQKLFYLPASHTDFIFSIVGEELGFLGTASLVILFLVFIWAGIRIASRAPDLFGYLLGVGITVTIGLQAIINMGVATGALPTTGIPLPFISFGGSSLLFNMTGVGLLLNVSRQHKGTK
ncbi:putative lipid II flippase FtsW [candidate division NPL-UPA2 bacterium]|nr:putative lipid II flippase FtsW [candidate division NPL-UPA2 bacterium]